MTVIGCRKECYNLGSRMWVEAQVPSEERAGGGSSRSLHRISDLEFGRMVVLKTSILRIKLFKSRV